MSNLAAVLFTHLQDAEFYQRMHQEAAATLPDGQGRAWLDTGCGPGGLTRVASQKGYAARGIDRDPRMIGAARRLAANRNSPATFDVADLDTATATGERFDVVSASSLLVVLPDPKKALLQLQGLAKPGGAVLIVEASRGLTRTRAASEILSGRHGRRAYMLQVWATVRSGRTLPDSIFDQPETVRRLPLLNGLANAWIFKVPPTIPRDNAGSDLLT
jgi:ubiquinone/menaquinone biosynthesis C-methylase UbiE